MTVSACVSHTCGHMYTSSPAPHSCLIKVTVVTCVKSVVLFDSSKHYKFPLGTGSHIYYCSNNGLMRRLTLTRPLG